VCVIGKSEFLKLVKDYGVIHPFSESLMDGDGYVLTVKEDVSLSYLEHKNLISKEVVFIPPSYVAHLTAKSKFGRLGLSFLNAAKVHSGFVGRLALEVVNLSNERTPIEIGESDPFMHFELVTRLGEPTPYQGQYQFQYMTRREVEEFRAPMRKAFKDFDQLWSGWLRTSSRLHELGYVE